MKIKKIKNEVLRSLKEKSEYDLMNVMFEKYKIIRLKNSSLINQKELLEYLNSLNNEQKIKWELLETKFLKTLEIENTNDVREWMFINRMNSIFPEVFTTKEIIDIYIRGDIYLNTPIKNINWDRGSLYIELQNTNLYYRLPKIHRDYNSNIIIY